MKSGWVIKKLGEVCELIGGGTPSIHESSYYGGNIPWATVRDMNCRVIEKTERTITRKGLENSASNVIPAGNVIISTHVGLGKVCFVAQDTAINQDLKGVIPLADTIQRSFLYYWFLSIAEYLEKSGTGSTVRGVKLDFVKNLEFPVPSLPEQKRIVAKIDAAFDKIDKLKANAERNLANAKELFQSALDEAMRPKKGWVEKRLGEVCDGRLSYGTSAPSCPYNGKVRYIRITDIDDEGRLLDELVSPKTFERKHILVEGDIVLARTGATVGKSYLYSPSDGDCVYAGYLIRARVNRSMVLPEFAFYFTKTGSYWQYIHTEQASAAQPNVNAEKYGNLLMPVPPLKEQREIVAMARVIHGKSLKLQHHYARQIADCAEMRQSVLRDAFEGRL